MNDNPEGTCARYCEATAYKIEIRRLERALAQPSVPREPTDAMIEASARGYLWINPAHHRGIWIAMYDAARAKE
jgi:hypothetical protein